jgi:acyl-CoA synthetase (AMP-forming)/AMP-acid ligase II
LCNELKNTEKKYELESLKKIVCGGGHLNDATINSIQQSFKNSKIHPVYGLSETSSPASIFTENVINHEKIGSSGKAIPGVYFSIRNDKKEELTAGEAGELWIKGSVVITSYWCNADANKESFSGGWFNSGDLAYIDNDGYLYIKGRLKDMINRGGEKIYPLEVENLLTNYPGVNEVALVAYPSEVYGEECIAFIITDTSRTITTKEIIEWAFINLARYKIPRKVVFVVDLPRTNNGKINKRILKDNIQKYL